MWLGFRGVNFLWANHGIGCPQGGLGPHSPWYPPTLAFVPGENLIILLEEAKF